MRNQAQAIGVKSDKREHHYLGRVREHGERFAEFDRPSVELLLNLAYTYDVIHTHIARKIETHGLSLGAFNVLTILSRYGKEGCQMSELGELLLVSRANVTGLVDYLVKKNLVERTEDARDRRVRMVRLTKGGQSILESILPAHYARVREMFRGMSVKDKAALSKLLVRLRHNAQLFLGGRSKKREKP
ncbi:MAG TPA: MarR family transcriptional regulator [Pyrinomonadaceae bacterium]|nr:MarR family transcriptional regulator [Pyrinomonadaceae bacterium]